MEEVEESVAWPMFWLLVLLNFFDSFFTSLLVWYRGYEIEGNPVFRWMMETSQSVAPIWICKAAVLVFLYTALNLVDNHKCVPRVNNYLLFAAGAYLVLTAYTLIGYAFTIGV
jgi:hypothetical protein